MIKILSKSKQHTVSTVFILLLSLSQWVSAEEVDNDGKKQDQSTKSQPSLEQNQHRSIDSFHKHKASESVPMGERLAVRTKVTLKEAVQVARLYFKASHKDKYQFVVLNPQEKGIYSAFIPAVGKDTEAVHYRIVVQNELGKVFKSEKYVVAVSGALSANESASDVTSNDGFINVFSEYPQEDEDEDTGFVDQVRYTYGASRLLNDAFVAGAGASSSGSSVAAASTTGSFMSAGTVGVVAAGVGVSALAVAATSGGDDSSSSSSGNTELAPCFTGFIEFAEVNPELEENVTLTLQIEDGQLHSESIKSNLLACDFVPETDQEVSDIRLLIADLSEVEGCIRENVVDTVVNRVEIQSVSTQLVSAHECQPYLSY